MAAGFHVDAEQIRRHVRTVDAVRARFGAVQGASAHIGQDDQAYGLLCSWLPAVLDGRHRRQDELLAYVQDNLALLAGELAAVADAYESSDVEAADMIRKAGGR